MRSIARQKEAIPSENRAPGWPRDKLAKGVRSFAILGPPRNAAALLESRIGCERHFAVLACTERRGQRERERDDPDVGGSRLNELGCLSDVLPVDELWLHDVVEAQMA